MKNDWIKKKGITAFYMFSCSHMSLTFSIKATRGSIKNWCVTIESSGQSKKQRKHWKNFKNFRDVFFRLHCFKSRSIEFLRGGNTEVFFPSAFFQLLFNYFPHPPSSPSSTLTFEDPKNFSFPPRRSKSKDWNYFCK